MLVNQDYYFSCCVFDPIKTTFHQLNLLPMKKNLDLTKLKVLEDDKLNVAKISISLSDRVENTVEKEEISG